MEIKAWRGDSPDCFNFNEYKGSNVLSFLNHDNREFSWYFVDFNAQFRPIKNASRGLIIHEIPAKLPILNRLFSLSQSYLWDENQWFLFYFSQHQKVSSQFQVWDQYTIILGEGIPQCFSVSSSQRNI